MLLSGKNSPISYHPQVKPAELTKNPFLIKKHLIPSRIEGVVSEAKEIRKLNRAVEGGGITFAPIKISFSVLGIVGSSKSEVPIPHIDGSYFHYELIRRPERNSPNIKSEHTTIRLSHLTHFQGNAQHRGGYIAQLNFPTSLESSGGGDYDLLITLKLPSENIGLKSVKTITKRVRRAFFLPKNKVNLVFLIDNSASMNRNDPARSRFSSIYEVLTKSIYSGKVNEIALIVFSQDAKVMFPFMNMREFNRLFNSSGGKNVLHPLHPESNKWTKLGRGNTDFSKVFNLAHKLIVANESQARSKNNSKTVVVFLTDGASNYPYKDEHLKLRTIGVPVYTVGLSHPDHLQEYQPETLVKISTETGGRFFPAESEVLSRVFDQFIELSVKGLLASEGLSLKSVYDPSELIAVSYYGEHSRKLQVKAYFQKTGKTSKEYELTLYHDEAGMYYFSPIGEIEAIGYPGKEVFPNFLKIFANESDGIPVGRKVKENLWGTVRVWVGLINKSGKVASTLYNKSFSVQIRPVRTVFLTRDTIFERINPHKPDIRYFSLTNQSRKSIFVDIELLNPEYDKKTLRNPVFEQFPLSLSPKSMEINTIIFPTAISTMGYASESAALSPFTTPIGRGRIISEENRNDLNKVQEYKFIVKTSEGAYLEHLKFSYQDSFNKTTVFNIPLGGSDALDSGGLWQKLLPILFFKGEIFKIVFVVLHLLVFLQIFKIWRRFKIQEIRHQEV